MSHLTLNDLFFSPHAAAGAGAGGAEKTLKQNEDRLLSLKSDIAEQLPKVPFKDVQKEIGAKIGEVLNVGLDDVLIAAWKKYQGFQEYADAEKHPPEETILVPLAKHIIQSAHHPHVDLLVRDVLIGSVQLDVELSLTLEGVVLKVQAGKILDVRAGSCKAEGSLKCSLRSKLGAKEILSLKRETPTLSVPGAVRLGDGIAIPPARRSGPPPARASEAASNPLIRRIAL